MIFAVTSVKIIMQSEVAIVERLGKYHKAARSGLNIIVPVLDKVANVIDLKTQVIDSTPQPVITRDNVTMSIDTVCYYQITDPFKATYEISNLVQAIKYLTTTTLRDIIGTMELDYTLSSREDINNRLRVFLDEATDKWGVRVERVEVKNIELPQDIKDAMEKQMRAEREKRALILQAEGEANAIKQLAEAEALKNETVFRSLREAKLDEKLLTLKSIEAAVEMARGSNKVFVPYEASSVMGSLGAVTELMRKNENV